MDAIVWNAILTVFIALLGWNLREKTDELSRLSILLNKTREEIARDTVTPAEIERVLTHMDNKFEKLNNKIDLMIKESRSALS